MKNRIKTRDWSMVRVIQGATKAAVHIDQRKQASRMACRTGGNMQANEFMCKGCSTIMPNEEMSTDPLSYGWCDECDTAEKEQAEKDEENDRDGWDDDWEDPAVTYERERGEAFQDRVDMWRREY